MRSPGARKFGPFAVLLLALPLFLMRCNCGGSTPVGGVCKADGDCSTGKCVGGFCQSLDGGLVGVLDASNPLACINPGMTCTPGQEPLCCSGICNAAAGAATGVCTEPTNCKLEGVACTQPTECCSLACTAGKCGGGLCATIDSVCAAASDCCSGVCTGGKCAAVPGATCKNLGETCAANAATADGGNVSSECCSRNCQSGRCARAGACITAGDICYNALDCCNGTCTIPAAGGPGTCAGDLTVPGATGCTIGGEVCGDSTGCCSHLCIDLGSGVETCVLGGGCRERGEICQDTAECCGQDTSGVVCQKAAAGDLVGRCANPQACQPIGNCCGAFGSNCRQACCNGQKAVCKLDTQGLSRCFGGCPNDVCPQDCPDGYDGLDPNCCIAAGQECQFRDQCCDLNPCIDDGTGKMVCKAQQCVPAGTACVPGTSICCNGLSCDPNGEIGFVCRFNPNGPNPTGVDGGTPGPGRDDAGNLLPWDGGSNPSTGDGGTPQCKANAQSCAASAECCSRLCIAGTCQGCKPDGQSCAAGNECCSNLCSGGKCVPPLTCVSQGGTCSGTAECCVGTVCDIAAGQSTGTCNPGSTCSAAGQSCSATQACCSGLRCDNVTTGATCAATDVKCTCRVIIN